MTTTLLVETSDKVKANVKYKDLIIKPKDVDFTTTCREAFRIADNCFLLIDTHDDPYSFICNEVKKCFKKNYNTYVKVCGSEELLKKCFR